MVTIIIIFVSINTVSYLWSFYKDIVLNTKYITESYVAATFSLSGSCVLTLYLLYTHITSMQQTQMAQNIEPELAPPIHRSTVTEEPRTSIKDVVREINDLRNKHEDAISKLEERAKILEETTFKMINDFSIKEMRENDISMYNTQIINGDLGKRSMDMKNVEKLGEITRIQGIREEHINLCRDVGVGSIYELSMQEPDELYNAIQDVAKGYANLVSLPTKSMVLRWIRIASEYTRGSNTSELN